jgi:hypothetical protein
MLVKQLKVLGGTDCGLNGIKEDIVRVAASFPHDKPSKARVFDELAFGGCAQKRRINYYPIILRRSAEAAYQMR